MFGKKESSKDTVRDRSTCKLEIAMANSCDPTKGIKDIGKGCKSEIDGKRMALMVSSMGNKDGQDGIAETSKALKSNQAAITVESIHPGKNKRDIFNSLCSDSQVQLQYAQLPHHTNLRHSLEEKSGKRSKAQGELRAFTGENFQNIWNFSGPKHASRSSKSFDKNDSERLYNMFNTIGMFQSSFDEVETTRICTTVDSVVGLSGKHSRFSQSLLITKKSDSNLFKADQTFINSRGGTDFGRHSSGKLVTPLLHHDVRNLHRFTNSKPQEKCRSIYKLSKLASVEENDVEDATNVEDLTDRKGKMIVNDRESSSETDIMDLTNTNSEKTHGHGVYSSPPVKVIKLGFSTTPGLVSFGGEEDRPGQHKIKLPDMNLEAPISSDDEQTLEYKEPITSRTQSLDKETVLSHAEHVNPLESVNDLPGSLKPEPGGRWLKRLKLNDSASYSIGKKSSDCMEKSHHERGNLSLKRFLESSMALASKNHGKEPMVVDEATTLKARGESSCIDSAKKDIDVLLSKSWIKRWRHHQETPKKNPNAEIGGGEPRNSNLLLEDMKKKQLPSIGAMALMAKTMNCLESYDIRKRGAVMVWSTKGF